jgi:3-methyladenine DNA glycosylase AlkD
MYKKRKSSHADKLLPADSRQILNLKPVTSAAALGITSQLDGLRDESFAQIQTSFFKTGVGDYGAGDIFIGVRVPALRKVARAHRYLAAQPLGELALSPVHEHRFCALVILLDQFERAETAARAALFQRYLELYDLGAVNNWDLVDISAPRFGVQLLGDPQAFALLERLADDHRLWHQRSALILSFAFIKAGRFDHTLALSERLIAHPHDLIHKASGWMLREVGKRDTELLRQFLTQHRHALPRTTLRYAIEKLEPTERARWMARN